MFGNNQNNGNMGNQEMTVKSFTWNFIINYIVVDIIYGMIEFGMKLAFNGMAGIINIISAILCPVIFYVFFYFAVKMTLKDKTISDGNLKKGERNAIIFIIFIGIASAILKAMDADTSMMLLVAIVASVMQIGISIFYTIHHIDMIQHNKNRKDPKNIIKIIISMFIYIIVVLGVILFAEKEPSSSTDTTSSNALGASFNKSNLDTNEEKNEDNVAEVDYSENNNGVLDASKVKLQEMNFSADTLDTSNQNCKIDTIKDSDTIMDSNIYDITYDLADGEEVTNIAKGVGCVFVCIKNGDKQSIRQYDLKGEKVWNVNLSGSYKLEGITKLPTGGGCAVAAEELNSHKVLLAQIDSTGKMLEHKFLGDSVKFQTFIVANDCEMEQDDIDVEMAVKKKTNNDIIFIQCDKQFNILNTYDTGVQLEGVATLQKNNNMYLGAGIRLESGKYEGQADTIFTYTPETGNLNEYNLISDAPFSSVLKLDETDDCIVDSMQFKDSTIYFTASTHNFSSEVYAYDIMDKTLKIYDYAGVSKINGRDYLGNQTLIKRKIECIDEDVYVYSYTNDMQSDNCIIVDKLLGTTLSKRHVIKGSTILSSDNVDSSTTLKVNKEYVNTLGFTNIRAFDNKIYLQIVDHVN